MDSSWLSFLELPGDDALFEEFDLCDTGYDPFYTYSFIYPTRNYSFEETAVIVLARANLAAGFNRTFCDRVIEIVCRSAYYREVECHTSRAKSSSGRVPKSASL